VVYSPDLHEIRAYNRMGQLASPTAEVLAFIQDDDQPPKVGRCRLKLVIASME